MIRLLCRVLVCTALLGSPSFASATPLLLDFEDLTPGQEVADHYSFSNGIDVQSGIALTQGDPFFGIFADFSARSGLNVVANVTDAAMTLTFSTPIYGFSAYVAHLFDVTVTAYSSVDTWLADATLLGDSAGSYELASLVDPLGGPLGGDIAKIVLDGSFFNSFVMDDVSILLQQESQEPPPAVPEPGTIGLMIAGAAALGVRRGRTRRR